MSLRERLRSGPPLLLGHRGDSARHPENTLAAFAGALDAGADGVELDVRRSVDGVLVVVHDDTLTRTTGCAARVDATTWEELSRLDAGAWHGGAGAGARVPRLRDALALVRGRGVVAVEIKEEHASNPQAAETVLDEAAAQSMPADVIVLAFDHRHLREARRARADALTGALVTEGPADVARVVADLRADAIAVLWSQIDARLCAEAHAAGAAVIAWTVDDIAVARRLVASGVDAVITNQPSMLAPAWARVTSRPTPTVPQAPPPG